MLLASLGALGVVYGDIGTSPLYAMKECLAFPTSPHAIVSTAETLGPNVLGVLSLIFWSLAIVVSLKYVVLVLRASNNGEGGTMALMALASKSTHDKPRVHRALIVMGILGAALFFGDGIKGLEIFHMLRCRCCHNRNIRV